MRFLWWLGLVACAAQVAEDQDALDALDVFVHASVDHERSDTFQQELATVVLTAEGVRRRAIEVVRAFAVATRDEEPQVAARGRLRQAEALAHAVAYFIRPTVRRPVEAIVDGDRNMTRFEGHIRAELRAHALFFACAAVRRWKQVASVADGAAHAERRMARQRLQHHRRWVAACDERVDNPGRVSIAPLPGLVDELAVSEEAEEERFGSAEVVPVIRAHLREIQRCYERELRTNADLVGKVTVRFAVIESGHVDSIRVTENTTGSSTVGACVTDVVATFVFSPPPRERVTFSYPFVFSPQD